MPDIELSWDGGNGAEGGEREERLKRVAQKCELLGNLVGLHDHKGDLTATWSSAPKEKQTDAVEAAWRDECEHVVNHEVVSPVCRFCGISRPSSENDSDLELIARAIACVPKRIKAGKYGDAMSLILDCAAWLNHMFPSEASLVGPTSILTLRADADSKRQGVYFVQQGEDGPIKIGFSDDVEHRLATLQTGSPYPLRLLLVIPGSQSKEASFHSKFADARLSGEWFRPVPELLSFIRGK